MSDSLQPQECSPAGSSVHGISQARFLEQSPLPTPRDHPYPGIEHESPELAGDPLPLGHLGSPWCSQTNPQREVLHVNENWSSLTLGCWVLWAFLVSPRLAPALATQRWSGHWFTGTGPSPVLQPGAAVPRGRFLWPWGWVHPECQRLNSECKGSRRSHRAGYSHDFTVTFTELWVQVC